MSDLQLIWNALLSWLTQIFNIYTSYVILAFSMALFILNNVSLIIRRVRGKR